MADMADNVPIRGIEFEIKGSAAEAAKSITRMANALQKLKTIGASGGLGLGRLTKDIQAFSKSVSGLKFGEVTEMAKSVSKLGGAYKNMGYVADYLRGISKMDFSNLTNAADVLKNVANAAQAAASAWRSIEQTGNAAEKAHSPIAEVGAALREVGSGMVSVGKKALSLTTSVLTKPFRDMGSALASAKKKFDTFLSSIGRIAMYRLLRTAMKDISQGIKTGIENLSAYSRMVNGEFHKAMDGLATDALYVKNSVVTIAAPIITAVKPAFDALADAIAAVSEQIAQFVALLTGQNVYYKAKKYVDEYGDAVSKAAAKQRKFTLAIDELNIFDPSKGSGSSLTEDYSKMFETLEISSEAKSLVDRVKEAFENADFTEIGSSIREAITGALDDTDTKWPDLKEAAEKVGKSIGTFINGIIGGEDFGKKLGSSIAKAINTAISFLGSFIGAIEWKKIGEFIGGGISGFVESLDAESAGKSLSNLITGFMSMIKAALDNTNWTEIGEKVADLLANIDWVGIIGGVVEIGVGIINGIGSAIKAAVAKGFGISDEAAGLLVDAIAVGLLAWKVKDLISKVLGLNSAFGDKNNTLGEQTGLTQRETEAVSGLNTVMALSPGLVGGVVTVLNGLNTQTVITTNSISAMESTTETALDNMETNSVNASSTITQALSEVEGAFNGAESAAKRALTAFSNAMATIFSYASGKNAPNLSAVENDIKANVNNSTFGAAKAEYKATHPVQPYTAPTPSYNSVTQTTKQAAKQAASAQNSLFEQLDSAFTQYVTESIKAFELLGGLGGGALGFSRGGGRDILFAQYRADGGFPGMGTAFIAGERGPEIVTNIGNRTGVINEEQLTGGIENGVERGMEPLLSVVAQGFAAMEQLMQEYGGNDGCAMSDRDLYRSWQRGSKLVGGALVKGV